MAKDKKEERNLSLNDIRGAVAEEHPERDAGLSAMMAMTSDTIEEQQPDGTYRFALNAVNEDRNEAGRLQNEESNEVCSYIENDLFYITISTCCGSLIRFQYTTADVLEENMHNAFEESKKCDKNTEDKWIIKDVGTIMTINDVVEYVSGNIGSYRIDIAGCEEEKEKINVVFSFCCNDQTLSFYKEKPYILEIQELVDLFNKSECADLGYEIGYDGVYAEIVSTNPTEPPVEVSDGPIEITYDCLIHILCNKDDCDCEILPKKGGTEVGPSVYTKDVEDPSQIEYGGNYVEFSAEYCDIENTTIDINMDSIAYNEDGFDDSLSEYWYYDENSNKIIIKFQVVNSGPYTFIIQTPCGEFKMTCSYSAKTKMYMSDGKEIGHIIPTDCVCCPEDCVVTVGKVEDKGIIGRYVEEYKKEITSYIVSDNDGNEIEVGFDGFPVNFLNNKQITIICSK